MRRTFIRRAGPAAPGDADRKPNVVIIGGYGFFGSRLTELLGTSPMSSARRRALNSVDSNAFNIGVGGRTFRDAESFCAVFRQSSKFDAVPLQLSLRDLATPTAVRLLKADMLINCVGPFYDPTVQWDSAMAAVACADAGVHYVDLGDAVAHHKLVIDKVNEFLEEKGAYRMRKSVVVGASTVPAISSAATEALMEALAVDEFVKNASKEGNAPLHVHIVGGMNPGNNTTTPVGLNAFRSVLMMTRSAANVLKPDAGTPEQVPTWSDSWTEHFPDARIGTRHFGIIGMPEMPDVAAAATEDRPVVPRAFKFGAGVENKWMQKVLGSSWIRSPAAQRSLGSAVVGRTLLGGFNVVRRFVGSKHGGMYITVVAPDRNVGYTWLLQAFDGDGAFVPCLPAVALARRILLPRNELEDTVSKTAVIQKTGITRCERLTDVGRRLAPSLSEIMAAAAEAALHIDSRITRSMYDFLMGPAAFAQLHPALRRFHSLQVQTRMQGHVIAVVPCTLGKLACKILSLPYGLGDAAKGTTEAFEFELKPAPFRETWIRHYPRQAPMVSHMRAVSWIVFTDAQSESRVVEERRIVESLGPLDIVMSLDLGSNDGDVGGRGLVMKVHELRLFGWIPVPKILLPLRVTAEERGEGQGTAAEPWKLHFFVEASLPVFGTLVQYRGHIDVPA